jgi:hypothetical protein
MALRDVGRLFSGFALAACLTLALGLVWAYVFYSALGALGFRLTLRFGLDLGFGRRAGRLERGTLGRWFGYVASALHAIATVFHTFSEEPQAECEGYDEHGGDN